VSEHGPKIEFEKTDADLKAVTKVGVGIAVVATVVALALLPILHRMVDRRAKSDAAPPAIPGFQPGREAPEPRLQREPFADWRALKARQDALLGSYGWVDEPGGVTRIPIDQAMKMVIERGLPVRVAVSEAPSPAAPAPAAAPPPAVASPAPTGGHR
jgi:hypothetical protein